MQEQVIEKEKMERELQVAHKIQMSILPRRQPQVDGFDFGALVVPMQMIGGDFYDFIPLGNDKLGIAIGDVSGHGVPAALFMALTVTLLRAEACRTCSPGEVLQSVNRQLMRFNDESMFVTILYGVLDMLTGKFDYVRAGHELPVLFTNQGSMAEGSLEPGQALGLFNTPLLSEQVIHIQKGVALLLYTDGVTEAVSCEDEMFGMERLKRVIRKHHHQSAQAICERVMEQVTLHRGEAAQNDDVTLVCIRVNSPDEKAF